MLDLIGDYVRWCYSTGGAGDFWASGIINVVAGTFLVVGAAALVVLVVLAALTAVAMAVGSFVDGLRVGFSKDREATRQEIAARKAADRAAFDASNMKPEQPQPHPDLSELDG